MMKESKKMILPMIFLLLIITTYILIGKNSSINQHMFFNNSFITLPLIFITTGLITHKMSTKDVRNIHKYAIIGFLIFLFILALSSLLKGDEQTFYYRASLDFVFLPKNTTALGISFAYPDFLKLTFFLAGYFVSQTTLVALINSLKDFAPKTISFVIGYLISIILYVLVFTGLNNLILVLANKLTFNEMIGNLTSYFIGSLLTCLISIIVFAIISPFIKTNQNN